jgi:hypothetical protein
LIKRRSPKRCLVIPTSANLLQISHLVFKSDLHTGNRMESEDDPVSTLFQVKKMQVKIHSEEQSNNKQDHQWSLLVLTFFTLSLHDFLSHMQCPLKLCARST